MGGQGGEARWVVHGRLARGARASGGSCPGPLPPARPRTQPLSPLHPATHLEVEALQEALVILCSRGGVAQQCPSLLQRGKGGRLVHAPTAGRPVRVQRQHPPAVGRPQLVVGGLRAGEVCGGVGGGGGAGAGGRRPRSPKLGSSLPASPRPPPPPPGQPLRWTHQNRAPEQVISAGGGPPGGGGVPHRPSPTAAAI